MKFEKHKNFVYLPLRTDKLMDFWCIDVVLVICLFPTKMVVDAYIWDVGPDATSFFGGVSPCYVRVSRTKNTHTAVGEYIELQYNVCW